MTALLTHPTEGNLWGSMPGWGIVADLTPPEVVAARSLRVLRRFIALGLALVVVLCAAGYVYAWRQHTSASDEAEAASAATVALQAEASKYSGVTQIEQAVSSVKAQIASVMATDVNLPKLITRMRGTLPPTMSIQNLTVTLSAPGTTSTPTSGLDVSGRPQIGTVTITGLARSLDDLPAYVDRLAAIPGVVNVLPTSNQASTDKTSGAVQYNVTLDLNDALYTHRSTAPTGGN